MTANDIRYLEIKVDLSPFWYRLAGSAQDARIDSSLMSKILSVNSLFLDCLARVGLPYCLCLL
jgi:hypothetical protein